MVSWALWTSGLLCCFMLLLLFYGFDVVVVAYLNMNAAVAHWVRAFAPQADLGFRIPAVTNLSR